MACYWMPATASWQSRQSRRGDDPTCPHREHGEVPVICLPYPVGIDPGLFATTITRSPWPRTSSSSAVRPRPARRSRAASNS
jgi:hypothetical protein